jgi:fatty acid desaturase
MAKLSSAIAVALAIVIVISFFLPWAHVESQEVGMFSKILTGKSQAEIASISGFGIPAMANSQDSRLAISVIKIFNPGVKDADKKSYLIWFVPIFAVIAAALLILLGNNKWVSLALGVICALIFVVGIYKIATTDMNKLVLNIRIGTGLWLTLYGYLGMGLAGIASFIMLQLKKR